MQQLPPGDSGVMSEKFVCCNIYILTCLNNKKGFSPRKYLSEKISETFKESTPMFLDVFWLLTIFCEIYFCYSKRLDVDNVNLIDNDDVDENGQQQPL